jgi:PadR family transcriptional regulator, regulatory protein PadR
VRRSLEGAAHTCELSFALDLPLLTGNIKSATLCWHSTWATMAFTADIPYGTLDLMVLKTLAQMGPLHGYGIARRIEQIAQGMLALNQGTIYPALLRLEQKGWISSTWGSSENNRRARFYAITKSGRKQLTTAVESWARTVAMLNRMLGEEG